MSRLSEDRLFFSQPRPHPEPFGNLADFFNSLLVQLAGDGVGLQTASCR